eukprot:CAMPEP_0118638930 /NCGR_PEP_ID=MMETSP0785-20121206/3958_1 /TAXON_ID=91992 /ORGANISM="Bolidomonas pacifica, Strain CCMP 1866" /LENGTH=802 /DNA_ID=CAMNT_0006530235 /DNA_START=77 /DNA_END=2481 /DNA_ORIENTATION=-
MSFFANLFGSRVTASSSTQFSLFTSAIEATDAKASQGGRQTTPPLPISLKASPPPKQPDVGESVVNGSANGASGASSTSGVPAAPLGYSPKTKKKHFRDCSVLVSADGLLLAEDQTEVVDDVNNDGEMVPKAGVISEFDSLRIGCDDDGGDLSANGFTLQNLSPVDVTNILSSTQSAMSLTHDALTRQVAALKRCGQQIANAKKPLADSLSEKTTSTPLLHESCSLKTALEAYSAYIDASYTDMADSLSFCDDVVLPRLATADQLLLRRVKAREGAVAQSQATVEELDAKLNKMKVNALKKHALMEAAKEGKEVNVGNGRGVIAKREATGVNEYLKFANDARVANDQVDDTAALLLSAISKRDTVARASRIAGESCLLSALGSQAKFLKSMVKSEKIALEKRMKLLEGLEKEVDKIDVRGDLSWFVERQEGKGKDGYNVHNGGVAAALALLDAEHNTGYDSEDYDFAAEGVEMKGLRPESETNKLVHQLIVESRTGPPVVFVGGGEKPKETDESISVPSKKTITKWTQRLFVDDKEAKKLEVERRHKLELKGEGHGLLGFGTHGLAKPKEDDLIPLEEAKTNLTAFLLDKQESVGLVCRSHFIYALNSQRSVNTEVPRSVYPLLGEILKVFLDGCGSNPKDIANAKMAMMLSQTFYTGSGTERSSRQYLKSIISDHPMWEQDDFWDSALFQCIAESLHHSEVMPTLYDAALTERKKTGELAGWSKFRRAKKWHDLLPNQRIKATTQVQGIVAAQLTALAHSMIEFGCGFERACKFVRRMCVRYQLSIEERKLLLIHLEEIMV